MAACPRPGSESGTCPLLAVASFRNITIPNTFHLDRSDSSRHDRRGNKTSCCISEDLAGGRRWTGQLVSPAPRLGTLRIAGQVCPQDTGGHLPQPRRSCKRPGVLSCAFSTRDSSGLWGAPTPGLLQARCRRGLVGACTARGQGIPPNTQATTPTCLRLTQGHPASKGPGESGGAHLTQPAGDAGGQPASQAGAAKQSPPAP